MEVVPILSEHIPRADTKLILVASLSMQEVPSRSSHPEEIIECCIEGWEVRSDNGKPHVVHKAPLNFYWSRRLWSLNPCHAGIRD
jgi:hypothetical protein